ncbi:MULTISPECIES: hypothetical protein [unclassified Streptomyces]|uniref:hypothetical protein n=1 Tax=unclassified Streptomyces TaxID=2593676 RepID=UPI00116004A4|nr:MULTISPECIES: hypothetical protein [unclassified Streptomyces]
MTARLLDHALLLLPTRFREAERLPDDAELYALLSFTPLTDRAQVVQNLADMLDTCPDEERAELSALLVQLFRGVRWEGTHRTDHPHAPTRRTRPYRDAAGRDLARKPAGQQLLPAVAWHLLRGT